MVHGDYTAASLRAVNGHMYIQYIGLYVTLHSTSFSMFYNIV